MWRHCKFITHFSDIFRTLFLSVFLLSISSTVYAQSYADICVWRNPNRTMTKIFPEAGDYKTIEIIINDEKRKVIENRIGRENLNPWEGKQWIYFGITDTKGKTLGYISAHAEKGEYGVIEMVVGITPDGRVKSIYIQRSREKDKEFKSNEFLKQFEGKTIKNPIELGKDITAKETRAVRLVTLGVKKTLIFYDVLGKQK